jgi:hypothetical protein
MGERVKVGHSGISHGIRTRKESGGVLSIVRGKLDLVQDCTLTHIGDCEEISLIDYQKRRRN